jgi:transposase-like protein
MNLIDVNQQFATEDACLAYLESMRWPSGVACLACGSLKVKQLEIKKGARGKTRRVYQCLERPCLHQFTATTGTIFHDTHLPLRKWFMAIALICDAKKGMSAMQLQRHLTDKKKKMSYRTAWYLCHRIRKAMEEPENLMTGTVEVDETYMGGKFDKRRKRNPWEKMPVVGLVERAGKVRARSILTASRPILVGIIRDHVAADARVITDQLAAYHAVKKTHRHDVINHIKQFARGDIHTNTVENFWSLLKRGIIGSYHKVSLKHLERYLAEFTYRFNRRDEQEQLFAETTKNLLRGKALEYKALTASQVSES